MDQNVIRLTKLHYRTALLSTIITNNVKDVREFIKKLNLKDAVMNLISGWDQIKEDTIEKCWILVNHTKMLKMTYRFIFYKESSNHNHLMLTMLFRKPL
jgi:hypothetical protein